LNNDLIALVGAAFGRLLTDGFGVAEQDRDDVLQAGYAGALEAARSWVPERGAFSTYVTAWAQGEMLNCLETEARGGIGSKHTDPIVRYGDEDLTDIDELTGETEPLGSRQVYDWTPEGFDPEVEAEALLVRRKVLHLPGIEGAIVSALFGIGGPAKSVAELATEYDVHRDTIYQWANAAFTRLRYRDTAAPAGWAMYRESAFARGAGATKASQPRGTIARRPYRRGRNNLWDPREAAITRAANRKAWLAAGRRANGKIRHSA
jgi:DNA-directed RNA polymerase specialized sigma24 family protein